MVDLSLRRFVGQLEQHPRIWRLLALGVHSLTVLMFWRFLRRLGENGWPGGFFAASLLAVHPAFAETVLRVDQLSTLLAAMLAVLSLNFILPAAASIDPGAGKRIVAAVCACILLLAALEIEVTAALAGLALLSATWGRAESRTGTARSAIVSYATIAVAVLLSAAAFSNSPFAPTSNLVPAERVKLLADLLAKLPLLLGWPGAQIESFAYAPARPFDARDAGILAVAAGAVICVLLFRRQVGWRAVAVTLLLAAGVLIIAVSGTPKREGEIVLSHASLYFLAMAAFAGVACGLSSLGTRMGGEHFRTTAAIAAAVIAALTVRSVQASLDSRDSKGRWQRVLDRDPSAVYAHLRLADLALLRRDATAAEAECLAALRVDSRNATAMLLLGDAQLAARPSLPDKAAATYRVASASMRDSFPALMRLAHAYTLLKSAAEAESVYSRLVTLRPGDAVVYDAWGASRVDNRDPASAISLFNTALRLDPFLVTAYEHRLEAHAALRDWSAADADIEALSRLAPYRASSYVSVGRALARRGEDEWTLHPDAAHFFLTRARLFLSTALQFEPDEPAVWDDLGTLYLTLGDTRQAIFAYTRAVQLDPQNRDYENNLTVARGVGSTQPSP